MSTAFEAMSQVSGVNALRAVGGTTLVPGTVTLDGDYIPTGTGTGVLAPIIWGNAIDADVTGVASKWTFLGDGEGGEGAWGVKTGLRHGSGFWTSQALGASESFTNGGAADVTNLIIGGLLRFTKTLTYWETPQIAVASDNVGGTAFSGTFNRDPGFTDGDTAILVLISPDDAANPAGITLTLPGTTQGTSTTAVSTSGYTAGNDARVTIRRVTIAGTSSGVAPSVASSTVFTGAALLFRIRDTNTAPTSVPVAKAGGDTLAEPYLAGAVTLDGSASSYSPGATFEWEHLSGGTGTVDITDDTALVTTATVAPVSYGDEDYTFRLTVTDSGGSDTDDKVVTVLRSTETTGDGDPLHLTLGG